MFPYVLFDIAGGCNAKCPLCVTARETFGQRMHFISVADFARSLDRLLELGFAVPGRTTIGMYNWSEPILHPDLNGIVAALNARSLRHSISTNASKKTDFKVSTAGFNAFFFSVPGWSQASYDKVHGFKFDRIVANMEATLKNMREMGFPGPYHLNYHVYQFNCFDERAAARAWCERNGVNFSPYLAFINDYFPAKAYVKGELPREKLEELSRTLFLHYVKDVIAERPKEWRCPQWDGQLVLNYKSEVLVCCALPDSFKPAVLGSLFDLSREEVLAKKVACKECDECIGTGVAYWGTRIQYLEGPGMEHEVKAKRQVSLMKTLRANSENLATKGQTLLTRT